ARREHGEPGRAALDGVPEARPRGVRPRRARGLPRRQPAAGGLRLPRGPRPRRILRRRRGRGADRARDGRRPGPPRGGGRPREGAAVRVIGAGGAVCAGAQRVCASAQFASGNRPSRAAPVPGTPLVPRGAPPPPPSPPAVIELQGISKYYSQGLQKTWVLRHVDLVVEKGEFVRSEEHTSELQSR